MTVYVWAPDLMDRSKITAAVKGAVVVSGPAALDQAGDGDTVVVDLSRPGAIEAVGRVSGARTVGFGSHVDRALLVRAREAGCDEVLARSEFFRRLPELLGS